MNENLQNAVAEILIGAAETVGAAKDFVLSEMPEIVQQLLLWKAVESLAMCGLGVLLLSIVALYWWVLSRQIRKKAKWTIELGDSLSEEVYVVIGVGVVASVVLLITSAVIINLTWLQIWLAPKVYLIEYASSLVK